MALTRIRGRSGAIVVALLLATLAACSNSDDREDRRKPSGEASAGKGENVVGMPGSECDLPVLVGVPENWYAEAMTAGMVERVGDEGLTNPGGFELVCSLLGSRDRVPAPIFIFVASPRVAPDLTNEQLLLRFVRSVHGEARVDVRRLAVGAGTGVEGTFIDARGPRGPVQRRASVLFTPESAVVVTNGGGLDQGVVDRGFADYEYVRDSIELRD